MNKIKVSVLIPICNVEKYLDECLSSLARQTLNDLEFICINDGSTDGSLEIIKKYAKVDKRFLIIDKKNSGYGDSMNEGLKKATGEYIGIVESDDFVKKEMFEDLYNLAKEHDAEVVKSNAFFYWADTNKVSPMDIVDEKHIGKIISTKKDPGVIYKIPSIWSAIYRRDFLNKNKICFLPTPGAAYQDTSFTYKVWLSADKVFFTEKRYLYYRQDNANSSMNNIAKKAPMVFEEFHEIEKFVKRKCPEKMSLVWERKFIHSYNFLLRMNGPGMWAYIKNMSKELKGVNVPKEFFQSKQQQLRFKMITKHPKVFYSCKKITQKKITVKTRIVGLFFQERCRKRTIASLKQDIEERKKYPGPEHYYLFEPELKDKISIIVPTYNDKTIIKKCIKSLVEQTYKNIEILIINDGTDVESEKIIERLALNDKRIRVFKTGHKGVATARNMGLEKATGDFIMWCDSDDYFEKNTCEKMLYELKKTGADFVECETNLLLEEGLKNKLKQGVDNYLLLKMTGKQAINHAIILKTDVSLWNKIYRNDLIKAKKIKFPDGLYFEDAYFNDLYLLNSKTGTYLKDEKLYNYIRKNNSIMSRTFNKTGISIDYRKVAIELYFAMNEGGLYEGNENFFWMRFLQYASFSLEHLSNQERKEERKEITKFIKSHKSEIGRIEKYLQKELKKMSSNYHFVPHLYNSIKARMFKKINSAHIEEQTEEIARLESKLRKTF